MKKFLFPVMLSILGTISWASENPRADALARLAILEHQAALVNSDDVFSSLALSYFAIGDLDRAYATLMAMGKQADSDKKLILFIAIKENKRLPPSFDFKDLLRSDAQFFNQLAVYSLANGGVFDGEIASAAKSSNSANIEAAYLWYLGARGLISLQKEFARLVDANGRCPADQCKAVKKLIEMHSKMASSSDEPY